MKVKLLHIGVYMSRQYTNNFTDVLDVFICHVNLIDMLTCIYVEFHLLHIMIVNKIVHWAISFYYFRNLTYFPCHSSYTFALSFNLSYISSSMHFLSWIAHIMTTCTTSLCSFGLLLEAMILRVKQEIIMLFFIATLITNRTIHVSKWHQR